MNNLETAYLVVFSFALIFAKVFISRSKDVLIWILIFYFYLSFGPVIAHLLGLPIYFGTPKEYIHPATITFSLATATMVITSAMFRPTIPDKKIYELDIFEPLPTIKIFLVFSITYASISILRLVPHLSESKIQKIAYLFPQIHYNYLFVQIFLMGFFFHLQKEKTGRFLFYLNMIVYVGYCLIMGERDFIFPIGSIAFHWAVTGLNRGRDILKFVLGGFVLIISATLVFFLRDTTQEGSALGGFLNQGSTLFINAHSLLLIEEGHEFFSGFTYLNSISNLAPSWIYKTDFNTLDWFKNNYAPNSDSGYGFALDAEAYLNFGYYGVISFFFILTAFQRFLFNSIRKNHFFVFYSTFFLGFFMYNLRNDSLALIKGNMYALLFFVFILYSSRIINYFGEKENKVSENG